MPERQMNDVVLRATFGDCCDGLVRVVDDVQRFGLRLRSLIFACEDGEAAVATIGLSIPSNADAGFVAMRLARHPSVTSVEVERNGSTSQSVLHASHSEIQFAENQLAENQLDRAPVAEPVAPVTSPAGRSYQC
jgi:hypothetical protein